MNLRRLILPLMLPMLFASVITSCINEDVLLDKEADSDTSTKGKFSVALRINSVDGPNSRADGDLIDGDAEEQRIGKNGNFIIFFDKNQNFYKACLLTLDATVNEEPDVLERVYSTTFGPDTLMNEDKELIPKYCLVLLNAPEHYKRISQFTSKNTVTDVTDVIIEPAAGTDPRLLGQTEDGCFTMSNSTYFDKDGVMQSLVEIPEDCIIISTDSQEERKKKIINVYVERLVAKFTFEVKNEDKISDDGNYIYDPHPEQIIFFDGYDDPGFPKFKARYWAVEVTGWGVNASETSSYLFKKLGNDNYFADWNWKNPGAYRTYWSIDEHYTGTYPWQYRRSDNLINTKVDYYEDFEKRGVNLLHNYSYNDLNLGSLSTLSRAQYVPENTYDYGFIEKNLDGRCDLLAGTHVLVGARLLVDTGDGNYEVKDWFRDRNGIYYESEEECFGYVIHGFNKEMAAQNSMRYVFYNWSDNDSSEKNYETNDNGTVLYARPMSDYNKYKFKIYWDDGKGHMYELNEESIPNLFDFENYNKVMADGIIQYGDGKRMPWPRTGTLKIYGSMEDDDTLYPLEIYEKDERTDEFKKVRNANINDIKSLLYEWVGALDHFYQGCMYYAAPAVLKKVNDTSHCGVVRNSWYQYTLTKIGSVGSPIDDLNQPIVPYLTNINDQININVEIKPWHIVPTFISDDDFPLQ